MVNATDSKYEYKGKKFDIFSLPNGVTVARPLFPEYETVLYYSVRQSEMEGRQIKDDVFDKILEQEAKIESCEHEWALNATLIVGSNARGDRCSKCGVIRKHVEEQNV